MRSNDCATYDSVETNCHPASPVDPVQRFGSAFCPPPSLPATVAHLRRLAAMQTRVFKFDSIHFVLQSKRVMNASIPQSRRNPPFWLSVVVWLSAFLSPAAFFLLMLLANRFQIPSPPAMFVWPLFFLIPAVALLICESVVWSCGKTVGRKIGWMLFTLIAMVLQFGIILVILRMIIVTAIGYVQ
jgi:hypothetical protein